MDDEIFPRPELVGPDPWPDVTVVLLVVHPGPHEVRTAELVHSQVYPGRMRLKVIDSSPDPTAPACGRIAELAEDWSAIAPGTFGHARTRNLAAAEVTTPVIAFLSQDAHPTGPRWLEHLVRPLREGRAEAAYGRQVSPFPDAERQATFGHLYPEEPQIKTRARIRELGLVTFHFSDVTSAFRTEVLREVGFPDVEIFEDVAVAKAYLDRGYRIAYVPAAVVEHVHTMGLREMGRRYRQIGSVYERLGIFADLKASGRSLVRDGLSTTRSVVPRAAEPAQKARSAFIGAVKLASVSYGRLETRWLERA
jgi:rhamnosyltransferase